MLYLLQSFTASGPVMKIGYAEDWEDRKKAYQTHNPGFSLLSLIPGSLLLESRLHSYFSPLLLTDLPGQKEWMRPDPKIPKFFPFLEGIEERAESIVEWAVEELKMHGLEAGTVLTSLIDSLYRLSGSAPFSPEAHIEEMITASLDLISLSQAPPFCFDLAGLEKENWGKVFTVLAPSGRKLEPSPYLLRVELEAMEVLGLITETPETLYMKWKQQLIEMKE